MHERTIWTEGEQVYLIDQTLLPGERRVLEVHTVGEMWEAIRTLRVRGAPAIGIAAALGVWLGVRQVNEYETIPLHQAVENACRYLATARPTAVNLFWALDRIRGVVAAHPDAGIRQLKALLLKEAQRMLDEDNEVCLAIGRHGASLLQDGSRILTHCNAGGLATAQFGTALAPVYFAVEQERKKIAVIADETRPLLQGARLTAWELMRAGVDVTLICDNMAGSVMRRGMVDAVIVGTDRVAANGDVANKIGTYGVAVLARQHGIPFYVAAPLSSIDISIPSGDGIPIEERAEEEVTTLGGVRIAPEGVKVYNPAFDITPAELVTAFITEKGIIEPPFGESLQRLFEENAALQPQP